MIPVGVTPADPDEVEAVWNRVAEEIGGVRPSSRGVGPPVVQLRERDWIITLERIWIGATIETRLRALFRNTRNVRFALRDERIFDDLLKTLGFVVDIELGIEAFDSRFLLKGYPAATVRDVLEQPVTDLVLAQPRMNLRVSDGGPTVSFVPGVAELRFTEAGTILDVERLATLFELFTLVLPRLNPASQGYEDDPDLLVERLLGPGGELRAPFTNVLEWDGDTPRREAARLLGERGELRAVNPLLSVLDDEDPGLVAAATRALGEIGAERVVPRLVRLLGEREPESGAGTVADAAGDALEALGWGALARAFEDALEGRPARLKEVAGPHRDGVVEALMTVVDSYDLTARVHAAEALGVLGANEALPLLRSKTRNLGMKTRLTEAAREAVEEIESRASLVRPAQGPPETSDTHPRPADEPDVDSDALPRAAEADEEEGP